MIWHPWDSTFCKASHCKWREEKVNKDEKNNLNKSMQQLFEVKYMYNNM